MKKFWTVMALMLTMALGAQTVEAKKFGGGKSFGQTRQTAPAQPKKTDNAQQAQQTPSKAADAGKKGMLGGLLGGLLVGGLIGSMLGNGAFEGIQFMDILLFGLIAFVIFKLLRRRATQKQSAAFSGMPNISTPMPREALTDAPHAGAAAGFGSSNVPFNLPAGFDLTAFLVGARDHYRTLQEAWNNSDLDKVREYVSPELYALLAQERAKLADEQHTEVLFVDAELVRADHDMRHAELSIKFSGRYRDIHEGVEEAITDIWHLERDLIMPGAPWLVVGIEG